MALDLKSLTGCLFCCPVKIQLEGTFRLAEISDLGSRTRDSAQISGGKSADTTAPFLDPERQSEVRSAISMEFP
jgi:hypothetical protein